MACQLSVFQRDYRNCKFLLLDLSGTVFITTGQGPRMPWGRVKQDAPNVFAVSLFSDDLHNDSFVVGE